VARGRPKPAHGRGPQALLQAVDEPGQGLGRRRRLVHGETGLAICKRLGNKHVEGCSLIAEVAIESVGRALEMQGDQAGDVQGIAAGRGKSDLHRLHPAVQSEQHEAQGARADGIARKVVNERPQETRGGFQHVLVADDRLHEAGLRQVDWRGQGGDKRLRRASERLVETQEQGLEAGGQRRARLIHHLADAAQAEAAQQRQRCVGQAQSGERQGPQCLGF
jgi:hypothetical protein